MGENYWEYLEATEYAQWSRISGSLPPGLRLSSSGYIGDYPSAVGTYTFTVKAENAAGSDTKQFSITITAEQQKPEITYSDVDSEGFVGQDFRGRIYSDRAANWSLEGNVPPGLYIEEDYYDGSYRSSAYIYGRPTEAGEFTFTIRATNSIGYDEETFTVNIEMPPPPQITTTSLPDGKVGPYYSERLRADYYATWSITNGSLPPGIRLDSHGDYYDYIYISGEPTKAGTYTFTVKAENAGGSNTKQLSITITMPEEPVIQTTSLPNGIMGEQYNEWLQATEYARWSRISGSLPPGLRLDSDGEIHGYPSKAGAYTFTVRAENATDSDTKQFSITITAEQQKPQITDNYFNSDVLVGQNFWGRVEADRAANWSLEGNVPPGLYIDDDYYDDRDSYKGFAHISGRPTEAGEFTFTVKATNSVGSDSKSFTIIVAMPEKPVIQTASLPNSIMGERYSQWLRATEFAEWSRISGSLPPGLRLDSDGEIYGYPSAVGTYTFTVKAENAADSDTKEFSIIITAEQQKPVIITNELPNGTEGKSWWGEIEADRAANWTIEGDLPPGLSVENYGNSYRGYIYFRGYPTAAAVGKTYTFTVKATNSVGSDSKTFTITITAATQKPTIITESLPNGAEEIEGHFWGFVEADRAANWSLEGDVPPGLSIGNDYDSYIYISGYPTAAAVGKTYTFTVKATNSVGSDSKSFTVKIEMPQEPVIITSTLPNGVVGENYRKLFSTSAEYAKWSIEGNLPPGIEQYMEFGYIFGEPTAVGSYTFTVKAENAAGSNTKTFTIIVSNEPQKPEIITITMPNGIIGERYSQWLEATEYAEWSRVSGNLPPGLRLDSDGEIYGTPTTAGTYKFTVRATNNAGSDTKEISITISSEETPILPPQIATSNASSNILAYAKGNNIVLQNLPSDAKVEVFDLRGRGVYSGRGVAGNALTVSMQTKGVYIVKVSMGSEKQALRVAVR
jgi:PKD repeat protein